MRPLKRFTPSPAMLVAIVALFISLSGVAVAGLTLANNSVRSNHIVNGQVKAADLASSAVTSAKLANSAINSAKVADGTLGVTDLAPAAVAALKGNAGAPGAQGPAGAPGAPGAPGSALGYAYVLADGTVDPNRSKNITSANVTLRSTAAFCFGNLPFTPKNAVATIDYATTPLGALFAQVQVTDPLTPTADCIAGETVEVATAEFVGNPPVFNFAPFAFYVLFN